MGNPDPYPPRRSNGQRITKDFVARKIDRMQRLGLDVALDGAYGKYKVTNRKENRNLSGRMSNAEVVSWLDAYEQGWEAHGKRAALDGGRSGGDGNWTGGTPEAGGS